MSLPERIEEAGQEPHACEGRVQEYRKRLVDHRMNRMNAGFKKVKGIHEKDGPAGRRAVLFYLKYDTSRYLIVMKYDINDFYSKNRTE